MNRRTILAQLGAITGVTSLAGCTDGLETLEETTDQLAGDAEEAVNETTSDLERPPGADLEVDDETVIVISLDPGTAGVKCGPIEGDDPLEELNESEQAATAVGETIEDCSADVIVAVSEGGNVEVIEQR